MPTAEEGARLVLQVMYEGPWERAMNWLWAIDRKTNKLRREVKAGSLRDRLTCWAEARHSVWVNRYVATGQDPPARWKRAHSDGDDGG
jgi:hypothetical protein